MVGDPGETDWGLPPGGPGHFWMRDATVKVMGSCVLATLAVALSACGGQTEAPRTGYALCGNTGVYRSSSGFLRICAPITDEVVEQVSASLTPEDEEVILTSDGGFQIPAIALGKLLADRDVVVRVRQFCLSACSTYVMAMADRVIVDPYTVVAFHHTAAFVLDAMASRRDMPREAWQRRVAADERQAYREAGRDDAMLDRIAMAIEPICIGTRQANGREEGYFGTRWDWFIPDQAAAREIYGDRISGHWMVDGQMATRIFQVSLNRPLARVRYGALPSDGVDPAAVGQSLPECEA